MGNNILPITNYINEIITIKKKLGDKIKEVLECGWWGK